MHMETKKEEFKREKSSLYPSYDLKDCIEFVTRIDNLGGKSVAENTLLGALKLKSRSTRTYTGKLSSSKQFGLVAIKGSFLEVTDIARRILYPTGGESEKRELLSKTFLKPSLYTKLVERFKEKQLLPEDILANVLMNEYGISKAAKDRAAKVFVDSAKYVGFLSGDGVLRTGEKAEPVQEQVKETEEREQVSPSSAAGMQSVRVTLSGGTIGTINVPNTITKKDVERLKKMLDLLIIEEE